MIILTINNNGTIYYFQYSKIILHPPPFNFKGKKNYISILREALHQMVASYLYRGCPYFRRSVDTVNHLSSDVCSLICL